VKGYCSFCLYWWNCWPWSLFNISFHDNVQAISIRCFFRPITNI